MKQKYHIKLDENTIADELHDLIINDMIKDGKEVNSKSIREYKTKLNKAFDDIVNKSEQEFARKEYVSLTDLTKNKEELAFFNRLKTAETESREGKLININELEKDLDSIILEEAHCDNEG